MATGAAFGALQGVAVAKLKMPPLIATLMGLGVAEGLSYLITGGSDLRSVPNTLASSIGQGSLGGVQWLIIISFLVTLALRPHPGLHAVRPVHLRDRLQPRGGAAGRASTSTGT